MEEQKQVVSATGKVRALLASGGAFVDTEHGQAYVPVRVRQAVTIRPGEDVEIVARPNYDRWAHFCPLMAIDVRPAPFTAFEDIEVDLETTEGLREAIAVALEDGPKSAGNIARMFGAGKQAAIADELRALYAEGLIYEIERSHIVYGVVSRHYALHANDDLPGEPPAPE